MFPEIPLKQKTLALKILLDAVTPQGASQNSENSRESWTMHYGQIKTHIRATLHRHRQKEKRDQEMEWILWHTVCGVEE